MKWTDLYIQGTGLAFFLPWREGRWMGKGKDFLVMKRSFQGFKDDICTGMAVTASYLA